MQIRNVIFLAILVAIFVNVMLILHRFEKDFANSESGGLGFSQIDSDQNGQISMTEVTESYSFIADDFADFDVNLDGQISKAEFEQNVD